MSEYDFLFGLTAGFVIGCLVVSLIYNYSGVEIWDKGLVESLKLCVSSHDFNSTACLYHKPF
jgi:hypothetical protein